MNDKNLITFERRNPTLLSPLGIAAMVFIVITVIISMGDRFQLLFLILFILLFAVLPVLAKKSFVSVTLDGTEKEVIIILNRWGRLYKKIVIPVGELHVTFKTVRTKVGFNRRLRLFHKNIEVASADSGDGWETETLEMVVAAIKDLKAK